MIIFIYDYLLIVAPEFITQIESETILSIGDDVVLSCAATGSPAPIIRWYSDGSVISDDAADINNQTKGLIIESNLTLTNVQQEQSGIYQCVAISPSVGGVANFNSIISSTYLLVRCKYIPLT